MGRVKFVPHVYQRRAIRFVEDHPRCLLFLDMGLGKTVIVLTAVQQMIDHGEATRVLVVAPKKVAESTWATEAGKWLHTSTLSVAVCAGTPRQREAALRSGADVTVLGRDNTDWLEFHYSTHPREEFPFDTIVIDELTSFKSHSSQRYKAMRKLSRKAERMIGLTGTPTPNGLLDLWAQVMVIDGGARLGGYFTHYRDKYFHTIEKNHIVIKAWPQEGAEEAIRERIADITLTMRAEDWLELPEMTEVDIEVELPEVTLDFYRKFEREKIIELRNKVGDLRKLTAESAAPLATKLSQYANGQVYDEERGVIETHDRKIEALGDILDSSEQPLLVFYQYRHDMERIMKRFWRLKPRVYGGDEDLKAWNRGEIRLLLAHPASTAYGLNMQAGGHRILWYSTGWNLELYEQANARLHRQGQREHVTVMRLIAKGTIDERMVAALSGKGEGQRGFLMEMISAARAASGTS